MWRYGLSYAANTSLGASPIYYFGTEEQKREWLVPLAKGETMGAFGLTEPNAGSDAGGTRTRAVLDGDEWVINGEKCWITNASYSRQIIVTAVTGKKIMAGISYQRLLFQLIHQVLRSLPLMTKWVFVLLIHVKLF